MSFAAIFKKTKARSLTDAEIDSVNERVEGTAGICHLCAHRGDDLYRCEAFPEGIPVSILVGMVSHEIPYEGDLGVQFKRKITVIKADVSQVPRDDRGRWSKVGQAKGSNRGGIFEKDGEKHYVKFPNTSGQVAAEVASDNLHELMGVPTMRHEARFLGDNLASVSKLQPVTPLGKDGWKKLTDEQKQTAANAFVASAWVKNWDVVGLVYDNMAKTKSGDLAIVDTGGSFNFRAQGEHKEFGSNATPELAAFLDPTRTAGSVFGPLHDKHPEMFKKAVAKLEAISEKDIKKAVSGIEGSKDVAKTLLDRRESITAYFDKLG